MVDQQKLLDQLGMLAKAGDKPAIMRMLATLDDSTFPEADEHWKVIDIILNDAIHTENTELAGIAIELGADINNDDDGFSALLIAITNATDSDDLAIFELLLKRGADVNARLINDETPLHAACRLNKARIVELLLEYGADPNAVTRVDDYFTPLMEASSQGFIEITRLLVRYGANVRFVNVMGESYKTVAAKSNRNSLIGAVEDELKISKKGG